MNEIQVKYRDWELFSDRETTEQTYSEFENSGAESCGCAYCKNYIEQRETVFPDEIKELFKKLGIDYKKEIELPVQNLFCISEFYNPKFVRWENEKEKTIEFIISYGPADQSRLQRFEISIDNVKLK